MATYVRTQEIAHEIGARGHFALRVTSPDVSHQRHRKASTSYIQRRLQIGYNRAASIMERMEKEGIIGPANHAGKRGILRGAFED